MRRDAESGVTLVSLPDADPRLPAGRRAARSRPTPCSSTAPIHRSCRSSTSPTSTSPRAPRSSTAPAPSSGSAPRVAERHVGDDRVDDARACRRRRRRSRGRRPPRADDRDVGRHDRDRHPGPSTDGAADVTTIGGPTLDTDLDRGADDDGAGDDRGQRRRRRNHRARLTTPIVAPDRDDHHPGQRQLLTPLRRDHRPPPRLGPLDVRLLVRHRRASSPGPSGGRWRRATAPACSCAGPAGSGRAGTASAAR